MVNHLDFIDSIETSEGRFKIYSLRKIEELGYTNLEKLPFTIKIFLENIARNIDGYSVKESDLENVGDWINKRGRVTIPFKPYRVVMQDYTGVPLVVDLAAMRDLASEYGIDPRAVDAKIRGDLIIDHSIRVDYHGVIFSLQKNMELEFKRFKERYRLLKWAQNAFKNLRIVPPGKGIIHQVNIEYLADVVVRDGSSDGSLAYPDTLIGTDSHTTMVNGIGVLGWGVGGIEAEAVLLGEPYYITLPDVIGVKIVGEPEEGVTSTDIVLAITEFLRKKAGVDTVGKLVEYYGPGLKYLSGFDRVTIANMAPEYGATTGFFPVDDITLDYLRITGRDDKLIELVEKYCKTQGLYYEDGMEPEYTYKLVFDLSQVEPSIAGPANPEDRIPLKQAKRRVSQIIHDYMGLPSHAEVEGRDRAEEEFVHGHETIGHHEYPSVEIELDGVKGVLSHGSIVIAAITSCTNTSNPYLLIGAGLLAKKAVEYGLKIKPWVKTSLAPGSRAVTKYLEESGLLPYLEALGFHIVGYGCTTCIGNSGPLHPIVEKAIRSYNLYAVSVLSGNRNFSGRIHPLSKGNFLASPIMVVAYAIKGTINWDPYNEPIGRTPTGEPVYLRDIWPSIEEINEYVSKYVRTDIYKQVYSDIYEGTEEWRKLEAPTGLLYNWDEKSTFIKRPPFFEGFSLDVPKPRDIKNARVLLLLGDRVTTDHISPAGVIQEGTPAAEYLSKQGVKPTEYLTYGSRRGNHEVMMRGTFANPRIRNLLVDREGGYTIYWPEKRVTTVYEAAMKYMENNIDTIVIAGRAYGTGSSRDWAAKGPYLLGVKAVIAKSFERIHRSNLIGMGILPLQFLEGEDAESLGLRGDEVYDILGIEEGLHPKKELKVVAHRPDGSKKEFRVICRLDNEVEIDYYINGGILRYVMRKIIKQVKGLTT